MTIKLKDGYARSTRTRKEEEELLEKAMEALSPEERDAMELILKGMVDKQEEEGQKLLTTINKLEYVREPVSMEEFVMSDEFLGNTCSTLYPKWLEDLAELFAGNYSEAVLTGAIGTGKTFCASVGICRILYELSCMRDPHGSFGIAPNSNISIVCISVNEVLATKVAYENIATKIEASPYFQQYFPFEKTKKELRFPKKIWVAARASNDGSVLGLNVIGSLLDECISAESFVFCAGGKTRAKDLPLGSEFAILTFDEDGNEAVVPARAKRSGDQQCYEVRLDNGMALRASWHHPVLVQEQDGTLRFKFMEALTAGDGVVTYAEKRSEDVRRGPQEALGDCEEAYGRDNLGGFRDVEGSSLDSYRLRGVDVGWNSQDYRGEVQDTRSRSDVRSGGLLQEPRCAIRTLGRRLSVARVVSKIDLGVQATFDVSVFGAGSETFVADGVVVHNTNFMRKAKSNDPRFNLEDHAAVLYNAIVRRMKSRFGRKGKLPGVLFLVSSKQTHDDFTAKRIQASLNDPSIFVRDYALWDTKPEIYFSGDWFHVVVGNESSPSRILAVDEDPFEVEQSLPEGCIMIKVPEDYRHDFESDLEGSIRDLAGVATVSVSPFIQRREKIVEAVDHSRQHPFSTEVYDPSQGGTFKWGLMVRPTGDIDMFSGSSSFKPILNPHAPRHIHIDPSLRGDSTGFCMAHIGGFKNVLRRDEEGNQYTERAPIIVVDLVLRIIPPAGGEILMGDVRRLVYQLSRHGFMITMVTMDSWNSVEPIQKLTQKGYKAEVLSVDRSLDPYLTLKSAFYDGRINYYEYPALIKELRELEHDRIKKKIDHPVRGCFVGDTRVLLANGETPMISELVDKEVEVWATDSEGRPVVAKARGKRTKYAKALVDVLLSLTDEIVRCTPEHPFRLSKGTYWPASELKTYTDTVMTLRWDGDRCQKVEFGNMVRALVPVNLSSWAPVYDLEVDEHSNFVLACGIVVHNSKDVADSLAAVTYTLSENATNLPMPIMTSLSMSPQDGWMQEQQQRALAQLYTTDTGTERPSQEETIEGWHDLVPPFVGGGGGMGGWGDGS